MSTFNLFFYEEISKFISELSQHPHHNKELLNLPTLRQKLQRFKNEQVKTVFETIQYLDRNNWVDLKL